MISYVIENLGGGYAVPSVNSVLGTDMFMLPRDLQQEEEERGFGPPNPNDDADLEHGGGAPARAYPLDPLANFIQELQNLSSMSGPDVAAAMLPSCLIASATGGGIAGVAGGRTARGLPVLRVQRVQKRKRGQHPWGSCKRICLFSNCADASGFWQDACLHRAVYRRHLHQARDSYPSHIP